MKYKKKFSSFTSIHLNHTDYLVKFFKLISCSRDFKKRATQRVVDGQHKNFGIFFPSIKQISTILLQLSHLFFIRFRSYRESVHSTYNLTFKAIYLSVRASNRVCIFIASKILIIIWINKNYSHTNPPLSMQFRGRNCWEILETTKLTF